MEIQKNSRQIPNIKQICADKKYSDILYAYLQCISQREMEKAERFIFKTDINFSKMAKVLNLSRQTISKKFNNLIDLGLIDIQDDYYILKVLPKDYASLIPEKTLNLLTDALSENSISTYVYLFNRYIANNEQPYVFTLEQIKNQIGISNKTRSNDEVVNNILFVLKRIGLIEYHLTQTVDESNFGNIKTIYQIDWVKNTVC